MDYKKQKTNILKSLKEDLEALKKKGGALTLPLPVYKTSNGEAYMVIKKQKYSCDSAEWYDVRKLKNLIDMVVEEISKCNGLIAKAENSTNYLYLYNALIISTKPCKEFSQLSRYIAKYANFNLDAADMFSVSVVGKRGSNYREKGERIYTAYDPKKCANILAWLKANKKRGTLKVELKEEIYDEDASYGRYYETETYGEKRRFLRMTITSSSNIKIKDTIWL